jgi:hypothetical protein
VAFVLDERDNGARNGVAVMLADITGHVRVVDSAGELR